jgi:hypothetical protein
MNAFARTLLASAVLLSPLCIADTFAQTASTPTAGTQTSEAQTSAAQAAISQDDTAVVGPAPAANDATQTNTEAAAQPQSARTCLTLTGSRVTAQRNLRAAREGRPERECANSNGRVYSEQDIERTGQRSVADVLRSLDTGIR